MNQTKATEAMVRKYRDQRSQYQEMGKQLLKEGDPEFLLGCALYWAEGSKRRCDCVFVNSDPDMMITMISFFRRFFTISDDRFSIRFNCHLDNNLTYQDVEDYWLSLLDLPKECIRKSTIKINRTNRTVKHRYGICSLSVRNGTEINQAIFGAIKEIANIDKDSW